MIVHWLLLIITSHLTHLQYVKLEYTDFFQRGSWDGWQASSNFSGKCMHCCTILLLHVLLHNCVKTYYKKSITLAVFSIRPHVRINSKNEVTQKGETNGGSKKLLLDWKISCWSLRNSQIPIVHYFQCYFCAFT